MNLIDRIHDRVSMAELLADYDIEYEFGRPICCPFKDHDDRSPSFVVKDDRFHCYGCGRYGDTIDFVANYEDCKLSQAVRMLCKRYGIKIRKRGKADELQLALKQLKRRRKPQRISMNDRMQFIEEREESFSELWKSFADYWGVDESMRLWPWWVERIEEPLSRLRKLIRKRRVNLAVAGVAYQRVLDYAVGELSVQHQTNVWAVSAGWRASRTRPERHREDVERIFAAFAFDACQIVHKRGGNRLAVLRALGWPGRRDPAKGLRTRYNELETKI